MRVPKHIGVIPDGNRRWAVGRGLKKSQGYVSGIDPGLQLFKLCEKAGVQEITYYGFTVDNTKRPKEQRESFIRACVDAVKVLSKENADLLVVGNTDSDMFPKELIPYTKRTRFGEGKIKVNFLVNYGWKWDIKGADEYVGKSRDLYKQIRSKDISRVDLVIRWGGRRRLSGFLPVQCVYSDFFVVEDYWPMFKSEHFYKALEWYDTQDITLGG